VRTDGRHWAMRLKIRVKSNVSGSAARNLT
jgi:hypothetical protein